jgi:hypothetical protein
VCAHKRERVSLILIVCFTNYTMYNHCVANRYILYYYRYLLTTPIYLILLEEEGRNDELQKIFTLLLQTRVRLVRIFMTRFPQRRWNDVSCCWSEDTNAMTHSSVQPQTAISSVCLQHHSQEPPRLFVPMEYNNIAFRRHLHGSTVA